MYSDVDVECSQKIIMKKSCVIHKIGSKFCKLELKTTIYTSSASLHNIFSS